MAQAIACDLCGQESAVMLETRIETGEVIAVGASCLIPFYVGAAESLADTIDYDDAAVYVPMIEALAGKPAWAGHYDATGELTEPTAADVLTPGEQAKIIADGGDVDAVAAIVAGVEGTGVIGEAAPVTTDQPARQDRNRARAPK